MAIKDGEPSSICTPKAGPTRALAPICKHLAIGCMKCSNVGRKKGMLDSMINLRRRIVLRAKLASERSMRWESWWWKVLNWGRTCPLLPGANRNQDLTDEVWAT